MWARPNPIAWTANIRTHIPTGGMYRKYISTQNTIDIVKMEYGFMEKNEGIPRHTLSSNK